MRPVRESPKPGEAPVAVVVRFPQPGKNGQVRGVDHFGAGVKRVAMGFDLLDAAANDRDIDVVAKVGAQAVPQVPGVDDDLCRRRLAMPREIQWHGARRGCPIRRDHAQLAVREIQQMLAVAAPARGVGHLFIDGAGLADGHTVAVDRAHPQIAVHHVGHPGAVGRIDRAIDPARADRFVRRGLGERDLSGGEVHGLDQARTLTVAPRIRTQDGQRDGLAIRRPAHAARFIGRLDGFLDLAGGDIHDVAGPALVEERDFVPSGDQTGSSSAASSSFVMRLSVLVARSRA